MPWRYFRRGAQVLIAIALIMALSPAEAVSEGASVAISHIESIISRDEGGRGIGSLVCRGDLLEAARTLSRLSPRRPGHTVARVLILSGFPCCVDRDPPTETVRAPPRHLRRFRAQRTRTFCGRPSH